MCPDNVIYGSRHHLAITVWPSVSHCLRQWGQFKTGCSFRRKVGKCLVYARMSTIALSNCFLSATFSYKYSLTVLKRLDNHKTFSHCLLAIRFLVMSAKKKIFSTFSGDDEYYVNSDITERKLYTLFIFSIIADHHDEALRVILMLHKPRGSQS